jgi:hypothetical protein
MHSKYVQNLAEYTSIQLTLDRYSHWIPTNVGHVTTDGMGHSLH